MSESENGYDLHFALNIARLWKAGKLIGADEEEVIFSLLQGYDALEARCREREEYAAKLERRTDKSLTEHAAGCIADQERIAQLEVIARDVYNGFKKEAWEGANEYFNEHPEVNKHYGSPKETKGEV